jgi:hypothetical protein
MESVERKLRVFLCRASQDKPNKKNSKANKTLEF